MRLYHFTSLYHLRAIGQFGLTVGDVPIDLEADKGAVGVWLTTSPTPEGHGLSGSKVDKSQFRLTVDVPDNASLHKWTEWARSRVSSRTMQLLATADGFKTDEHYVYFGWVRPEAIVEVVETRSGLVVENWQTLLPETVSLPGVPFAKRSAWHRRLLKNVRSERRRLLSPHKNYLPSVIG